MVFIGRLRVMRRVFRSKLCFPVARINNERGIALVLSLVMLVLLAILGAWVLNTSSTELRIAGNATNTQNAFYCGDAGVAYATNPSQLTAAYNTALAGGAVEAPQRFPLVGTIPVGSCNFWGNIEYLSTGQLANVQGRVYDQNTSLDTSNATTQRFRGLYFVVDSRGNAAGTTLVPVQMGLQQVVGN